MTLRQAQRMPGFCARMVKPWTPERDELPELDSESHRGHLAARRAGAFGQ